MGVVAVVGCFDPTDQHGNSSDDDSGSSGASTSTQGATTTTTASSTDGPTTTSTTGNPTTTTEDPTDPTSSSGVDESSSSAATSESTGDATGSESSTGTTPGGSYGPSGSCADGEIEAEIQDVNGCYCAPPCMDMTCPAAPEGTAMAQCAVGGEMGMMYCALVCDPTMMGQCPTEMDCIEITSMPGVGVCTYPP
jgi:hypothetical protein